ncbi:MAG: HAMP domain-containing protein [Deltaproteobacteria bacterium]|nr:HAMP domain-containing protein [Deltaproteobacteria bacterium]
MPADYIGNKASPREEKKTDLGKRLLRTFKDPLYRAWSRIQGLRIPIFIKLAALSTLLIFMVISTISFSMLNRQKEQFIGQLINLGEAMAHIAASNAPDKLLGEEELSLFQLLNDIAKNEQVIYTLVTDDKNVIKAHSNIEEVNKPYSPPENIIFLKESGNVKVSSFIHEGEEVLFFEKPIIYQKLRVGDVRLAISQKKIFQNIRDAKIFIVLLTAVITVFGILLSLGLSRYFSGPIRKLRESTSALGMGNYDHQVIIKRNDELGDLGSAFNKMAEDLALKEKIRHSFGQYVTPEIVDLILANPDMKGSEVEATVLFVDIRGFMTLSEDKEPESIVELLNDYFTRVTDAVIKHGGHVNKFAGDEAMAVFGAPVHNPQHAEAAVRAALDIQAAISGLDREKPIGDIAIQVGIGINSGVMVAGNLGSEKRMEYTVIGDDVNVASRLTSLAKPGEILISGKTYELIKDKDCLNLEKKGKTLIRGRKMKIGIFKVLSLKDDEYGEDRKEAV